ncbi:MAG: GNAT family N-acetyltransferase [Proteobacteria bacterium]|nr:GNAT family N-acetyltransferase [Pseudomonadota bacterium]
MSDVIQFIQPEMTFCAFVDGKLATSYAAWPMTMRFNGNPIPFAGITFVGTSPVYRGLGCLRQMTQKHFEHLYETGERGFAALYASQASPDGAVITKTGKSAEMTVPIDTLAMLVFGQISTTEAARMGRLDVLEQNALPKWDRVLKTAYRPFCANLF